jgi:hypothetical protein
VTLLNFPFRTTNSLTGQGTTGFVPMLDVTIAALNQTFADGAIGREWYLIGTGDCRANSLTWRVGADVGVRWGTAKLDLVEIRHLTHAVYGGFVAVHSDLELPCGCCIFQAGIRGEYGYYKSDLLQRQNETDLQSFNLMLTVGARF